MYSKKNILLFIAATLAASVSLAQIKPASLYPEVKLKGTQHVNFKSGINGHDYVLDIQLPASYKDSTMKKYPVLYALDGQWNFPWATGIQGGLLYDNITPEVILVGIGWEDNYSENRQRDFTPTQTKETSYSGSAAVFLKILKNEVQPFLNTSYRSDTTNTILQGSSFGGLFALYTLFHEPDLFKSYIACSPALNYDNGIIFNYEKNFASGHSSLNKKLFLATSEYEEQLDPVTLNKFIQQVKTSKYKGLIMDTLVVPKTGHASQSPYAVSRGLEFIFRKPDVEVDISLLDSYAGRYEMNQTFQRIGKSLYLTDKGRSIKMHALSQTKFYVDGLPGTGEFIRDKKGKVTSLRVIQNGNTFEAKKLD